MLTRRIILPALVAAVCAFGSLGGAAEQIASLSRHFGGEPPEALVRHFAPGPGFAVALPDVDAAELAKRWRVSVGAHGETVASDPATGLTVVQQAERLAQPGLVLIDTTLTNRGQQPRRIKQIAVADWTFRLRDAQDEGYRKLAYRHDVWYGSTYWTGPDWTRVGKDWHHSGVNTPSVRRFTCPRDGHVTITGRVYKLDTKPSDGVRLAVRHGKRTVWQAEIDGPDAKGVEPKIELDVRAGDAVRFVVHKRGQIYCDTTHWDPVITYAGGPAYQASKSFSTTRQGLGGWSYEMEAEGHPELGLPRVHAFGPDFTIRELALNVDQTVALGDADALPIVILADGAGQGGLLAAISGATVAFRSAKGDSGVGPWRFHAAMHGDEKLHVVFEAADQAPGVNLAPGQSLQMPSVVLAAYGGSWPGAMRRLQEAIDAKQTAGRLDELRRRVAAALQKAGSGLDPDLRTPGQDDTASHAPELDLWLMVQDAWRAEDKLDETPASCAAATAGHLENAGKLLADLQRTHGAAFLASEAIQLQRLAKAAGAKDLSPEAARRLYQRVRWLKRRIVLANPLMDFGKLLFCKRVPTSYSHLVMQYYGWRARPGGGIFVLEKPGRSLACRDILDGKLQRGCVLEPRLSFDGRKIVFSYVDLEGKQFDHATILNDKDEGFYHVWTVNVDGTGLKQVTAGPYDDLMPTWLPDGGIAFCSTRRRGYARCFGGQFSRRWHVYTLHRVEADGSDLRTLSFHDTNEWFPTVSHTGHILYARWDYIDRDAVTHQNLWATRPDGTNPVALWGNGTPSPHCTFQLQPIPGTSKIVFAASAHHSVAGGSIAIVDPTVADNGQEAITRITPEIPFPEAESRKIQEYYTAPWPLSEKYFLVGYSPTPLVWEAGANKRNALGIYLLDAFGNRELIYRDPEIGSTNPCPLRPRRTPPVLASALPERAPPTGEMVLADVYEGLGDVARGSIKELRIVQIFPKTTNVANTPPIGIAREENGRAILGTVPVEADGSARFAVPARKLLSFQALDADGFAYQTMHSGTYVQPGERVSCVGCHESRMTAPTRPTADVLALRRPPSKIDPGPLGGRPFSYVEVVQPVLDRHCVKCHGAEKPDGGMDLTGRPDGAFTKSYTSLCGDVNFWGGGTNPENAAKALVPRMGGRNQIQVTPPGGMYGALGSRLMKLLREGHENVKLSPDELRRLAAWIDLNAIFYGVNLPEDQARLLRGERLPMPEIQ